MEGCGARRGLPIVPIVAIASMVTWSSIAAASGFASSRFGGEHGNPTESNPTALYYNPAGIALSDGVHLFGEGNVALRHATWDHAQSKYDVPEPPGAAGANYGKASLTNVFGAPALGATGKMGDLGFGVGVFVPFGGRGQWDKNDRFANLTFPDAIPGAAVDGVQRWHGYEGAITFLYLTAGVAYRLGPLSIGVAGNFVLDGIKSKQAKAVAKSDNNMLEEARSEVDVSGKHGSFGVGLLFEALPSRLFFGLSYQSAPGITDMKMKGTLTNADGTGSRTEDVNFTQKVPDVFRFGARFRPSADLELRLFGDFTRWSRFETQCIALEDRPCGVKQDGSPAAGTGTVINLYRGWRDSFGIRGGLSRWFSPAVEVFVGLGFETAAVPDETLDPNLPDSHIVSGSLGGRFEMLERFWLTAGYAHLQYLSRDNTGKSILDDPTVHPTTRRVDGGGKYAIWIGVVTLGVEKQF